MAEKKPLPSISRRAPNARPVVKHDDADEEETTKTIQDFFPAGDVDERVAPGAKRTPVAAPDDGFVMDFDTPVPAKRR